MAENIRKSSASSSVALEEATAAASNKTTIVNYNKDKATTTSNTKLQQIMPMTKSKLEIIDKQPNNDSIQALGQPLNQTDVDKISTRRQSFDENKLSSADVLTIATAAASSALTSTTMPQQLNRKKSKDYDRNKLPTIQKQKETIMKKDSLLPSSLSPTTKENSISKLEKPSINRLKSVDNHIDLDEKMYNQWLREEIKKIILKNNLACTCNIDKYHKKKDDKFVQYIRSQRKLLTDIKPKLTAMHGPDWKTWKTNLKHSHNKYSYKTTGMQFFF